MTDNKSIDATKLHGPEHVRVYEETDGEVGHNWRKDSPILILTTTGRKSGEERKNALIYGMAGDNPVDRGLQGRQPAAPRLVPEPAREARGPGPDHGDKFPARARDATPEERPELWEQMAEHLADVRRTTRRRPTGRSRS